MHPVYYSSLKSLPLLARGKVRDIYEVDSNHLLLITTDRLSAFDVIMQQPIPYKGVVLNQLANFWFAKLAHLVPNHLTDIAPQDVVKPEEYAQVQGRAVVVKRLQPILVEAVVRGYLAGNGWKEYQQTQSICGVHLPAGLENAAQLPEPIFTPAAKAQQGLHDENISFAEVEKRIGVELANQMRQISLALYREAAVFAQTKGLIIADTKFEFGLDKAGRLVLIDEVLTADSSRFWAADQYRLGTNPPSFDKQFVRDWLETQDWAKEPPAPNLPNEVVQKTSEKYQEALERLVGKQVAAFVE